MVFSEMTDIYYENHRQHINTVQHNADCMLERALQTNPSVYQHKKWSVTKLVTFPTFCRTRNFTA